MMAGRMTSSRSSSSTVPCICPDKPIALMLDAGTRLLRSTARTASAQARHQSAGSCSAHAGPGDVNAA